MFKTAENYTFSLYRVLSWVFLAIVVIGSAVLSFELGDERFLNATKFLVGAGSFYAFLIMFSSDSKSVKKIKKRMGREGPAVPMSVTTVLYVAFSLYLSFYDQFLLGSGVLFVLAVYFVFRGAGTADKFQEAEKTERSYAEFTSGARTFNKLYPSESIRLYLEAELRSQRREFDRSGKYRNKEAVKFLFRYGPAIYSRLQELEEKSEELTHRREEMGDDHLNEEEAKKKLNGEFYEFIQ